MEKEIHLQWSFISNKEFMRISSIVYNFLIQFDKQYLSETIFMILKELLMNANRAIAKKEYFLINEMNPVSPEEYNRFMLQFKSEFLTKWEDQKDFLERGKEKVFLDIEEKSSSLHFIVRNTTKLFEIEKQRILARFEKSDEYSNIIDAYRGMGDSQESAGLGIIMSILLLRNIGLGRDNLTLKTTEHFTSIELMIPKEIISIDISQKINEKIINEVQMIPALPDSLSQIIALCSSPEVDMNKLVDSIERNPSVSAEILKMANSPIFNTRVKSKTLSQAVKKIGTKAILKILYAISTMKVMNNRYTRLENQWEHSQRTSFYSNYILKDYKLLKLSDSVVVGALLHNIGKFILLSLDKDFLPFLSDLTKNRATENTKVIEEATVGVSYSKLGSMLANKWNFPIDLCVAIEYHQQPYMAPPEFRRNAEIVYLANMLAVRTSGAIHFYSLDENILKSFQIHNQSDFEKLSEKYEKLYQIELREMEKND
ncbi:MAG: HDOD domain-containing protein [Leptospiraceae bacterium]|nr:HDOD domain-containing protein [Leptospiraceae bacterium]